MRTLTTVLALLCGLAFAAGCEKSHQPLGPSADSNTNWLMECSRDGDCDSTSCLCGQCTVECTEQTDCGELDGARCTMPEDHDPCMTSAQAAPVCLRECESDADCGDRGDCLRGRCLPPPLDTATSDTVAVDAGVTDLPPDDAVRDVAERPVPDDAITDAATDMAQDARDVVDSDLRAGDCLSGCMMRADDPAACERICAAQTTESDLATSDRDLRADYCLSGCRERGEEATACQRLCAAERVTDAAPDGARDAG